MPKNRETSTVLFYLLPILFLISCVKSNIDVEQERAALLKTDREFAQASVDHGVVEAFKMYLTEDAIQLPQNSQPHFGKQAIAEAMSADAQMTLTWQPQKAEVAKSGDLGYTWGTYEVKVPNPDGGERTGYGKYLNIWKKQPDDSWKVVVDMGNQSPPPEGTP